ncbi:gfo/Idh/MocA family oxidoreductase [Virgibacillus dakarensis]|uniref:Gfo/Idh/MocA family protein n=1 Tax=Virgibacillus dakarensis TaxID=1917889 RepID=UPI000B43DE01|nr:Gfo/Idh/MocA family oxidoreductase [Virgibacillus dakarensis]MTW84403.1 gfo/Idh/MocA family oxidoreductase [Virgibacillus dakarensis]
MIKFGIIGMGTRGQIYADTIKQSGTAEVAAITDINEESLEVNMEKYNTNGYTKFGKMFEKEKLDAVIVATPDFLHKDPVVIAAEKGIHVMVEKPFSTDLKEATEMVEAIKRGGVKCLVGFENRWNSPFVAAKETVDNGDLGEIVTLNSRLNDTIYVPTKMLKWSLNSTPGWFLLSHSIDLACWLKNVKPIRVFSVGTRKKLVSMGIDTYDSIQATVAFSDNTHATFTSSWILPETMPLLYDFKYEIIGENGSLYVDLHDQMVKKATGRFEHVHTLGTQINGKLTSAPSQMLLSFIDNIRYGTDPIAGPEDGLLNTKIVNALHKSIEEGEIQEI